MRIDDNGDDDYLATLGRNKGGGSVRYSSNVVLHTV